MISPLLKTKNNKNTCEKCKGTGFIIREDNTVDYCDCVFSSKETLLKIMNIPKRYWNITNSVDIFNGQESDKSYTNAYVAILEYVDKFKNNKGKGLFFMGPPGVGKTYLSIFALLYIEEKYKIRGLFYDVRTLILDLKSLIGKDRYLSSNSYEKLLMKILKAPILVLDDLGSEILTDYNKDVLTYIIAFRYNEMMPIIITANFNLAQHNIKPEKIELADDNSKFAMSSNKKKSFDIKTGKDTTDKADSQDESENKQGKVFSYDELPNSVKSELKLRLGESIASRLGEMCNFVYIFGEDRRISKSKKSDK